MDITDKSVIKWQRLQIKNLEDEILRLKTNLNGSQLVLQESIKEYMDEIVSKTDTINELKNTIERQEILIEKLKCCGNCNKCMYLEGYGYKCKEEEVSLFDIREIPEWCESWELAEDIDG